MNNEREHNATSVELYDLAKRLHSSAFQMKYDKKKLVVGDSANAQYSSKKKSDREKDHEFDAGRLRRGLQTSLAATAALMEACEGAQSAMNTLQRESESLVSGVQAQIRVTKDDLDRKWQQQEADIASIAEDLSVTLENSLRTIEGKNREILMLEEQLEKQNEKLYKMESQRSEEQAQQLETVRLSMKMSEERETENIKLREALSELRGEMEKEKVKNRVLTDSHPVRSHFRNIEAKDVSVISTSVFEQNNDLLASTDGPTKIAVDVNEASKNEILQGTIISRGALNPPPVTTTHKELIISNSLSTSHTINTQDPEKSPVKVSPVKDDKTALGVEHADEKVDNTSKLLAQLASSRQKREASLIKARRINRRRSYTIS